MNLDERLRELIAEREQRLAEIDERIQAIDSFNREIREREQAVGEINGAIAIIQEIMQTGIEGWKEATITDIKEEETPESAPANTDGFEIDPETGDKIYDGGTFSNDDNTTTETED